MPRTPIARHPAALPPRTALAALLLLAACVDPREAPAGGHAPTGGPAPTAAATATAAGAATDAPAVRVPDGAQWIWSATGAPDERAWFTAEFTLEAAPAAGQLGLSADNHATVWLNGRRVAHDDEWTEPVLADVTSALVAGRNTLAIEAANDGGPAGLLAFVLADGEAAFRTDAATTAFTARPADFPGDAPAAAGAAAPASGATPTHSSAAPSSGATPAASAAPAASDGRPAAVLADYGEAPWGKLSFGGPPVEVPVVRQLAPAAGLLCEEAASGFGSLIAFTLDEHGTPVVSVESGGLLALHDDDGDGRYERSTPFCDELRACQGLCFTGEQAWATGIGPAGLGFYRLDAGVQPRHAELVAPITDSAGEHGPHAVVPGPDGRLWLNLGNHVRLGAPVAASSPYRLTYEGCVLPRLVDPNGHAAEITAPGGTILAYNRATGSFELYSAGYRNAYDLAFAPSGDLFTFDSDMEWDIGLPWYRAVRVVHVLPGGDYGWRTGSAVWPAWYPDALPPVLDTGRGSPTGMAWCDSPAFPAHWRNTLLLGDWSQGQVLAVHLSADGITYRGRAEVLLSGRPLPVTDLAFEPGGALLVSVGGRGTQGALLRLRADPAAQQGDDGDAGVTADLRSGGGTSATGATGPAAHATSSLRGASLGFVAAARPPVFTAQTPLPELVDALASPQHAVRYLAARALEQRPVNDVEQLAGTEPRAAVRAEALVVLARQALAASSASERPDVLDAEGKPLPDSQAPPARPQAGAADASAAALAGRCAGLALPLLQPDVPMPTRLVAARALELSLLVGVHETLAGDELPADPLLGSALLPLFPSGAPALDRELAALIARTAPKGARAALLAALDEQPPAEEACHLLYCLAALGTDGKTSQARAALGLVAALRPRPGGNSYQGYLDAIERRLIERAPEAERETLRAEADAATLALPGASATIALAHGAPRRGLDRTLAFVRNALDEPDRSPVEGALVFAQTCAACHVRGGIGRAGGPDLSSVGSRLGLADLLVAIMDPSRDISDQYRSTQLTLKDGRELSGLLLRDDGAAVQLLTTTGETLALPAADITERRLSRASAMPEGLVDGRSLREIADLASYLLAADPPAPPGRSAFEPLFANGLGDWRGAGATWSVDHGVLLGTRPASATAGAPLLSPFELADFTFECEVLLPDGSAALAARCSATDGLGAPAQAGATGYAAELGGELWGSLTDERDGARIESEAVLWRPELDRGGWNHLLLAARGGRLRVVLNGIETATLSDAARPSGALAFRLRPDGEAPGAFRFAELRRD